MAVRDLIIIGAGPSGLSAAIAASKRDLDYQVIEQGVLVNSIFRFPPQMVFFTTPELLEIGGLPFVSPFDKPTRREALRYYRKVVDTYDLQIAFDETVLSVEREDADAGGAGETGRTGLAGSDTAAAEEDCEVVFAVTTRSGKGVKRVRQARNVLFAIGYFDHPNLVGIPGEDLPHVHHYYGEPHRHYRQRVVIVGGGNSSAEAALELYRSGAHVTLVHRHPTLKRTIKYWVRPDIENRIKEGSIAARFSARLTEIRPTSVLIQAIADAETAADDEAARARELAADADASHAPASTVAPAATHGNRATIEEMPADAVYLLTGYRADTELMCRAGIRLTEREGPVYDPQTFETNVRGLFVAGGAVAGIDTGTIFIENGRFHGEKIVETIARRAGARE
jgi:bacillithiol disulfide reductase